MVCPNFALGLLPSNRKTKAEWLKNAALYDDMLKDESKVAGVFSACKKLGYSDKTVMGALKKLGKDSDEYKIIVTRYREYKNNPYIRTD